MTFVILSLTGNYCYMKNTVQYIIMNTHLDTLFNFITVKQITKTIHSNKL